MVEAYQKAIAWQAAAGGGEGSEEPLSVVRG